MMDVAGRSARRVTLLTTVDFWTPGSGHRARILSLVQFLSARLTLTVLSPVAWPTDASQRCAAVAPRAILQSLDLPLRGTMPDALHAVRRHFEQQAPQACIVEFLRLAWMRQAMPPGVLTLLDTHAVASEHDASVLGGRAFSAEQERRQLQAFDRVIAICEPDAAVFRGWLGDERVVLAPYAHPVVPLPLRPHIEHLLVVAGDYGPNIEGLQWLLDEAWPALRAKGLQLHVVGAVGPAMKLVTADGLHVHGVVPDLGAAYAAADLCINPVRLGGGLKIKTVEALAHGRPLVTTSHGARSLEADAGTAFVVADDAQALVAAVRRLVDRPDEAAALSQAALALARRRFDDDACYGPLLQALIAEAPWPAS